jgi:hypothetical protein
VSGNATQRDVVVSEWWAGGCVRGHRLCSTRTAHAAHTHLVQCQLLPVGAAPHVRPSAGQQVDAAAVEGLAGHGRVKTRCCSREHAHTQAERGTMCVCGGGRGRDGATQTAGSGPGPPIVVPGPASSASLRVWCAAGCSSSGGGCCWCAGAQCGRGTPSASSSSTGSSCVRVGCVQRTVVMGVMSTQVMHRRTP